MSWEKKRRIIFVLALIVAALAVCYAVVYITTQQRNAEVYEQLQEQVTEEAPQEPEVEEQTEAEPVEVEEPKPEPYVSEIDFSALQETNPDIYAWIEIPGTDVAYPVLRGIYYLDHTVEGKSGLPGSIFTDEPTKMDFSGFNAVLYGHNMKNGSMFGSLKKYRDEEYLKEHPQIIIYTPTSKLTYTIFATVVYDDRLIPAVYDENVEDDRKAFLKSIRECRDMNSRVLDEIEVNTDSRIITLSTCIANQASNRYLVLGVLTDEKS